jgi:membrane-associated phospholipid phosphatase
MLILWLDQPLAQLLRGRVAGLRPFFGALTSAAEVAYETTQPTVLGWPALFWALGLAYVVGRWLLRRRTATVWLVVLLTHLSSVITTNIIKGLVRRLRPEALFLGSSHGVGFGGSGPLSDSFPSGHTAVYWSLFLPLAVAFPRWRVPLLAVPVLVALGRLVLGEHYLSDVWAAIWLVAAWTTFFGLLRRLDRPALPAHLPG